MKRIFLGAFFFGLCFVFLTTFARAENAREPVKGWAWASVGQTSGDGRLGAGWIRMSWDTPAEDGSKDPQVSQYSVSYDPTTRQFSGYAWSGIKCEGTERNNAACGYGWLSFNEPDVAGCPSSPCAARVDADGKISGWARFIAAKNNGPNEWDGFVNLRGTVSATGLQGFVDNLLNNGLISALGGTEYGVCFGSSEAPMNNGSSFNPDFGKRCLGDGDRLAQKKLSGWAWGGDLVGWVLFMGDGGGFVPAPTVTAAAQCMTDGSGLAEVKLDWKNGANYSAFNIFNYRSEQDKAIIYNSSAQEKDKTGSTSEGRLGLGVKRTYKFEYQGTALSGTTGGGEIFTSEVETPRSCGEPPRCVLEDVRVSPSPVSVILGKQQNFIATPVYNTGCVNPDPAKLSGVTWLGVVTAGGGAPPARSQNDPMTADGVYTAKSFLPAGKTDLVTASMTYDGKTVYGRATVTIEEPFISCTASCVARGNAYNGLINCVDDIGSTRPHEIHVEKILRGTESQSQTITMSGTSFTDTNVEVGKSYTYKPNVYYTDGEGYAASDKVVPLTTNCGFDNAPVITDISKVILGPSAGPSGRALKISWQDNASIERNHSFQLQRIKVTPETPTMREFTTAERQDPFGGFGLRWENKTTVKTPFQQFIRRFTGGTDRAEPFKNNSADSESRVYLPTNGNFQYSLPGTALGQLDSGKTYYYQTRACSEVTGLREVHKTTIGGRLNQNDGKEIKEADNGCRASDIVSITTPPVATVGNKAIAESASEIKVSWNTAASADGYIVEKFGGGEVCSITANTVRRGMKTECGESGLLPDTSYSYKVFSYKYDVEGRNPVKSAPSIVSAKTYYRVATGVIKGAGSVVVSSNKGGGGTCSTAECFYDFPQDAVVTFTPSGSFEGWTACSLPNARECKKAGFQTAKNLDVTLVADGGGNLVGPLSVVDTGASGFACSVPEGRIVQGSMTCSLSANEGTRINLVASAGNPEYTFSGWGGGCTGTPVGSPCPFILNSDTSVTARFSKVGAFAPERQPLYASVIDAAVLKFKNFGKILSGFAKLKLNEKVVLKPKTEEVKITGDRAENVFRDLMNGGSGLISGIFGAKVSAAINLDPYWETVASNIREAVYDDGETRSLDIASVYLYRVQACYDDAGCVEKWSKEEAGVTDNAILPNENYPAAEAQIYAVPSAIAKGDETLISWSSKNAVQISLKEGNGSPVEVSRSGYMRKSPDVTTKYTIIAQSQKDIVTGKSTVREVTVTVGPPLPPPPPCEGPNPPPECRGGTGGGGGTGDDGGTGGTNPCNGPNPPPECVAPPVIPDPTFCALNPNALQCVGGCVGVAPGGVCWVFVSGSYCESNSICRQTEPIWTLPGRAPTRNCENNDDCRNVGASAKTIRER